jgi:putative sulfotransferase
MPADPAVRRRPPICLVLSTGRCGGTLLSNIARMHPGVLSISELFSALLGHDLRERELAGTEFWEMLSTPAQADTAMMLRCQIAPDELLYPVLAPRPGARRFSGAAGVPPPPLMQVTLPHLTSRPDDFYAKLEAMTVQQPRRLLSEHFWWLFDMLSEDRPPMVVVERSGGSLRIASELLRLFPDARVVHLFRDGRECAVSMSRHASYKLSVIRASMSARFGFDPYALPVGAGRDGGRALPMHLASDRELAELTPDRITRAVFDRFEVPLGRYGLVWSNMIAVGVAELAALSRLITLDYGDLVARPIESIDKFLEFLGVERDPAWETQMAAKINPGRDVRTEVGKQQWEELTRACRLGMNRIYGRGGWT